MKHHSATSPIAECASVQARNAELLSALQEANRAATREKERADEARNAMRRVCERNVRLRVRALRLRAGRERLRKEADGLSRLIRDGI